MFMVGVPIKRSHSSSHEAIEKAIEMNGVSVSFNIQAFRWGRYAVLNLRAVEKAARHVEELTLSYSDNL